LFYESARLASIVEPVGVIKGDPLRPAASLPSSEALRSPSMVKLPIKLDELPVGATGLAIEARVTVGAFGS
jgi:hypothetical protein